MTEQEMIQQEVAKENTKLLAQLKKVVKHQVLSNKLVELLFVNSLIEFGPPSESCKYNHWRLTAQGQKIYQQLQGGQQ